MDRVYNSVNTGSMRRRNTLYSSHTMLNEQGWIHRCLNAVKNKQGSPHLSERVWVKKLVNESMTRFRTWNKLEIVDAITKMKMNFMCQQETMWVGEKTKELDSSRSKH